MLQYGAVARLLRIVVCLAVVALALAPASALAQGGTTTSAGDNQYVDPLTGTTTSGSSSAPAPVASPSSSSPSGTSSTSGSTSSATGTSSGATSSTGSTASSSDAPASQSGNTLPFTGFNLWTSVGVGVGLLGAGLVLRRVTRRV